MKTLVERMTWLHEPQWGWHGNALRVHTQGNTDCWQRTHYGFRRDNAHALLLPVDGEFRVRARFRFTPNSQYDQCGLVVRRDPDCWFKCSVEFENPTSSRLGSVVTNAGYSDWATSDVPSSIRAMSYELAFEHGDLVASWSTDGEAYSQMRVAHLGATGPLLAGIYGCSPTGQGFEFEVTDLIIEESVSTTA